MHKTGILDTRLDGLNDYYSISSPKVIKASGSCVLQEAFAN